MSGEAIAFKLCGGKGLISADLTHPIDPKYNCDHCGEFNPRIIMDDGDIHEHVCLCGDRTFMDTDGYTDRTWKTKGIIRLACLNRDGDLHVHIFKDGEQGISAEAQVKKFYLEARGDYRMILPMDRSREVLVDKARKIAAMIYNDPEQTVWFSHHYNATLHQSWGGPEED